MPLTLPPAKRAAEDEIPQRVRFGLRGQQQSARHQQAAQLRQRCRVDLLPGAGLNRQDHVKAVAAEIVVLSARPPAAGARAGNRVHHESEPRGLLLVRVYRVIAQRHAGLRQHLKDPPGRAPGGAEFEYPQGPIARPIRRDLAHRRANEFDPGGADRRGMQQVLDHRQRGCIGLAQTASDDARQFLGSRRDKREFGDEFRRFGEKQAPHLWRVRQIVLADQSPALAILARGTEPRQQAQ